MEKRKRGWRWIASSWFLHLGNGKQKHNGLYVQLMFKLYRKFTDYLLVALLYKPVTNRLMAHHYRKKIKTSLKVYNFTPTGPFSWNFCLECSFEGNHVGVPWHEYSHIRKEYFLFSQYMESIKNILLNSFKIKQPNYITLLSGLKYVGVKLDFDESFKKTLFLNFSKILMKKNKCDENRKIILNI